MKTTEAVKHFETATNLAKKLGVTKQAISNWGLYPPIGKQYQIQVMTKGKLKATEALAK